MNRRILPYSLVVCGAILAYACSSKDSKTDPAPTPVPEGGTPDTSPPDEDANTPRDAAETDSAIPPSGNPIEGIAAPTEVAGFSGVYVEGPVWRTNGLYYSAPYAAGNQFFKLTPPADTNPVRAVYGAGNFALGNAYDAKTNTFVSCEVNGTGPGGPSGALAIVRTPAAGGPGTPITLSFDAGGAFDAPNDLVVRSADGTIYVTDPGYQNPGTVNNHIWRLKTSGATTADIFETIVEGRPNGIAFSPGETSLYVSFTDSTLTDPLPTIWKYAIAPADGALGTRTKFSDVGPIGSKVDGLAVDSAGNVYAAVVNGVDVFKADGSGKWGHITTTKQINGVAFGGADKKTLYMSADNGLLQVTIKIAGIE